MVKMEEREANERLNMAADDNANVTVGYPFFNKL